MAHVRLYCTMISPHRDQLNCKDSYDRATDASSSGVVAVQRDVIIDRERGIAAEVEKVVVAVDLGDGNIAVSEQQRVKGVQFLGQVCG